MVKCTCGRTFENLGKLRRHIKVQDSPVHVPDRADAVTDKMIKRYGKGGR